VEQRPAGASSWWVAVARDRAGGEYPGTWPGPGGTRPPTGGSIVDRGKVACDNEARIRGYNNVSLINANPSGSMVNVSMRGFRSNREYVVNCQYASNNNVARLTSEDRWAVAAVAATDWSVAGSDACSNKARHDGLPECQRHQRAAEQLERDGEHDGAQPEPAMEPHLHLSPVAGRLGDDHGTE
jgi:hypothetical protein